jgi:hypothetical protein
MTSRNFTLLALLAVTAGCTEGAAAPTKAQPAATDPVVVAITIAKAIQAAPTKSDSILKQWTYTAESFEKLLADIAKDSAQSARYSAGMR